MGSKQALKVLQKYLPATVSEIALYGPGSMVRFSSTLTRLSEYGDGWVWFFEEYNPKIAAYLDSQMLDKNDTLIRTLFRKDYEKLAETLNTLRSAGWRGSTVTVYGQTILIDEDWVHFQTHHFFPQTFQTQLDRKRITPTKKVIINKVTEKQAKDFTQRREQLAKLFKGSTS